MNEDRILIRGLRLATRIGVPDAERAEEQELLVDLEIVPPGSFAAMNDAIESTVDYQKVCERLAVLAASGERQLIETLADEMAKLVLADFGARRVRVEIRKFILPQTEWVGVVCERLKIED